MSTTLTTQDQNTIRLAAYGAVTLLSAAAAAGGSPHKVASNGSIALGTSTGLVGHILAKYPSHKDLNGRSVAEIADRVLPALTEASALLRTQAPDEAANFRGTVLTALESATHNTRPTPAVTDMIRKITAAIDAA
ncbi:hypothetical protein ACPPVO_52870 [Dactylosporangium sp. McL0621]|uniref:hypothetical protein n=1 Tax=Dactylosporangium sp. McL0621 TaxID=3415678 RepID=UPI003CF1D16B